MGKLRLKEVYWLVHAATPNYGSEIQILVFWLQVWNLYSVFQCDELLHGPLGTTVLESKNSSVSNFYFLHLFLVWLKYTKQQERKSLKGLEKSEKSAT